MANENNIVPRLKVRVLTQTGTLRVKMPNMPNRLGVDIPLLKSVTTDAVLYIPQELNESEQSVARNNIGITDEMYANLSSEVVNEDFQVMGVTVGTYTDGDWIRAKKPDGTPNTTWEVLRTMLTKIIDVIAVNPTILLNSTSGVMTIEIGTTINQTLSVSYIDGRFSGQSGYSYNVAAGCEQGETEYYYNGMPIQSTSTITFTNAGNAVFRADTNYSASTVIPKKNDGTDSDVNIAPGIASGTRMISVSKKMFYGNVAAKITTDTEVRSLDHWEWNRAMTTTLSNIGSGFIVILPKNRNLGTVVTGNNQYLRDNTKNEFEEYEITMRYSNDTTEKYNAYLFMPATAMETNVTMTIL